MFMIVKGEIKPLMVEELLKSNGKIKLIDLDGRCLMKGVNKEVILWKIFGLNGNGGKKKKRGRR